VFRPLTLRILALLLLCLGAVIAGGYAKLPYLATATQGFILGLLTATYFFSALGVPGLLQHGGHCGWAWCNPTPLGWLFLAVMVLLVLWVVAWMLARVIDALRTSPAPAARRR
jgi:hypothetical protein